MKTFLAFLTVILCWAYPAKVASAYFHEPEVSNLSAVLLAPTTAPQEPANEAQPVPRLPDRRNSATLPDILKLTPYDQDQVQRLIENYAIYYGISPDLPLRIARCESGLRWDAKNPHSSASGPFQYLASTWRNTEEGRAGISVFDAEANVRAAVKHIAAKGTSPWLASKHCWNQ